MIDFIKIVVATVVGGIIIFMFRNIINKHINKKNKEKTTFEEISQNFYNIIHYKEHGKPGECVPDYTQHIFSLSSKIKSKKYNDILPEIKEFGKKYKDSIPPGGAQSLEAEKLKNFWEEAKEIWKKMEQKINQIQNKGKEQNQQDCISSFRETDKRSKNSR